MNIRHAPGFLRRFARDTQGISALEFALVAPILVALYVSSVQVTLALTADRKVAAAATTVGDLVAQDDFITDAEIADIFAAGDAVMQPFDPESLNVRVTSVRMNADGELEVDWSEGRGLAPYRGDPPEIPDGLLAPMGSVVLVETEYAYVTPFETGDFGRFRLADTAYLRPRRSPFVRRED